MRSLIEAARTRSRASLLLLILALGAGCVDPFPALEAASSTADRGLDRGPAPDRAGLDPDLAPSMDASRDASLDASPDARPDAVPTDLAGLDDARVDAADVRPDAAPPPDQRLALDGAVDLGPVIDAAPPLDRSVADQGPELACPPGALWALAAGGFCVRIQRVDLPEGWTGVFAHGAARMPDGSVRIAGGAVDGVATPATWRFVDDALEAAPELNREKRSFPTVARRDGAILLIMGDRTGVTFGFGDRADNRTHRWSEGDARWDENPPAKNPVPRSHAAAVQLRAPDDRVVVVGGFSNPAPRSEVQLFAADAWTATAPLLTARAAAHVVLLPPPGQRVMAFGGIGIGGAIFEPELIDLAAPEPAWQAIPHDLGDVEHAYAASATAPDGRIYVTGGLNRDGLAIALFLELDPVTLRWRRLEDLPAPVARHTLTALPDGRLVLMGGLRGDGGSRSQVWVFEEGVGWLASRALEAGRRDHTATLLDDGRILVVGGYDAQAQAVVEAVEVHTIRPR